MEEERVLAVWLAQACGAGSPIGARMMEHFDSFEKIWLAEEEELAQCKWVKRADVKRLLDKDLTKAKEIVKKADSKKIRIITIKDKLYSSHMKSIYAPPVVYYCFGKDIDVDKRLCISVVGTRRCSKYGATAAIKFGTELAECGCVIVSGLADGIDSLAQKAAVQAGGSVIAVLGSGIDVPYPQSNRPLMTDIVKNGLIISEFPPGTRPNRVHFPIRNRLIAGLSAGCLVVEAPYRSGALITASYAIDEGRDIFAVPSNINSETGRGTNKLIKQGIKAVNTVCDILEEYITAKKTFSMDIAQTIAYEERWGEYEKIVPDDILMRDEDERRRDARKIQKAKRDEEKTKGRVALAENEREIYKVISEANEPVFLDDIVAKTFLPVSKVAAILLMLEVKDVIKALPGKRYKIL